jgi:uncharacterized membrane protein required for colicin V production
MIGSLSIIDLLFLITIVLLVFNGLRNGAVFSLFNLLRIPVAFIVAYEFGPQFTNILAANKLPATPFIAYVVLFLGTVFILHIIGTVVRGVTSHLPLINIVDSLIGGVIGFVEAWIIWLVLLIVLHNFLQATRGVPIGTLASWQSFYNTAVSHSLFAKVNSYIVKTFPNVGIPQP